MPEMFVNPIPGHPQGIFDLVHFDFPAGRNAGESLAYTAPGALSNINVSGPSAGGGTIQPAVESLYGLLGVPGMEQGHPHIQEIAPEAGDPLSHDQVVDIDRPFRVCYTGRLSGRLVAAIANASIQSMVKFYAHPLTRPGDPITLDTIVRPLTPGAAASNTWFWRNPATQTELLFTADTTVNPASIGLSAETVYRLVSKWEFYLVSPAPRRRLPISGFNAAEVFEVITETFD